MAQAFFAMAYVPPLPPGWERMKDAWGPVHMSPVNRASPVVCSYEKFQPGWPRWKMREAPAYKLKMAPYELISIVPLAVELSTRVTLLLQLNGILLKWKIQQIRQNAATEAAKRPFSYAQLKYFHPGQPGWSVHMSPVNRDLGWPGCPGSRMNTSQFLQRK